MLPSEGAPCSRRSTGGCWGGRKAGALHLQPFDSGPGSCPGNCSRPRQDLASCSALPSMPHPWRSWHDAGCHPCSRMGTLEHPWGLSLPECLALLTAGAFGLPSQARAVLVAMAGASQQESAQLICFPEIPHTSPGGLQGPLQRGMGTWELLRMPGQKPWLFPRDPQPRAQPLAAKLRRDSSPSQNQPRAVPKPSLKSSLR